MDLYKRSFFATGARGRDGRRRHCHRIVAVSPLWIALFLMAVAASADFRLTDPSSDLYYRYGLLGGAKLKIGDHSSVAGNVHSNGTFEMSVSSTLTGNVSAVGKLTNRGTITGTATANAPALSLPVLSSNADLKKMANRVLPGGQLFTNAVINDVVFVDGDVTIHGSVAGVGTIIAAHDLHFEAAPAAGTLDSATRLSFLAVNDILTDSGRTLRGVLYAGHDATLGVGTSFTGVVVALRNLSLGNNVQLRFLNFDQVAPTIQLLKPANGALLNTAKPGIQVGWSDDFSGLKLTTLRFLLDGTDRTPQATVSATGFTFTPTQALPEGPHTIDVTIADHAANVAHTVFHFTTDTLPPAITITSPVNGQTVTSPSLQVTGKVSDASAIAAVTVNGQAVGLAGGVFSTTVTLVAGANTITVVATDAAGNTGRAAVSVTLQTDTTPPTITITAPNQPVITGNPTPAVAVTYSDAQSEVDTTTLKIAIDGTALAGCTVGVASATCTPPALAAGNHTVTTQVKDHAGNLGTASFSFQLVLDTTPPTVNITSPNQPVINNNPIPTVAVSYSDAGAGVDTTTLKIAIDSTALAGCMVGVASATCTPPALADGSHAVSAEIKDRAGNRGTASFNFNLDTTSPTVAITSPNQPVITNNPTPTVAVTYSDTGAGLDASTLKVAIDGTALADCTVGPVSATCTPPALAAGHHTVTAEVKDGVGNLGMASFSFDLMLEGNQDTEAPAVAILVPSEGDLLPTTTPRIMAAYSDSGAGVEPATIHLSLDGTDRTAEAQIDFSTLILNLASPLAQGPHSATIVVSDRVGHSTSVAVHFKVDSEAPDLSIREPSQSVLSGVERVPIRLAYADAVSGIALGSLRIGLDGSDLTSGCSLTESSASCETPPLAAGQHTLSAEVHDLAGNAALAKFTFETVLDQEAPVLAISSPSSPLVMGSASPAIRVDYSDAGSGIDLSSLRVAIDGIDLGAQCQVGPSSATCQPSALARGPHSIAAQVADLRGNVAHASFDFALEFPLVIAFTAPSPDFLTGVALVRVTGTVSPAATSVRVNGVAAQLGAGTFSIDSFGLHEGVNELVAVAEDAAGNTGMATVRVIADTTRPVLGITFPADGAVVSTPSVWVNGLVNDLTIGTVSDTHVTVTVNGVAASVVNRSFVAPGVPLQPGSNTLMAEATDRAGNRTTAEVHVAYHATTGVPTLQIVSGDGQSATISTALPAPLVVAVSDAAGQPQNNAQVVFQVVRGNGTLEGGVRAAVVRTDAQGHASIHWTIGSRAGVGVDRVRVTAVGVAGEVSFSTTALTGLPAQIDVASGDRQRGAVGTGLALPLFAVVTDSGHNPVPGVAVTFRVAEGGGGLVEAAGADAAVAETDASGLASVRLTLGPAQGLDNNSVEATFADQTTFPATFRASGFLPGDPAQTRVSGVVLDNQSEPVPGVTMRVRDTSLTTTTDAEGQFLLTGVPVGQVFLIVDATTTTRPGNWASLEYEFFAIAGVDNTLPRPVYILPLDLPNGVLVDETHGGKVTLPEVPGFALEIAPGSVTFPGGSRSGIISVTAVHADRVPMPPGAGMQPRLIVTIQPVGARFDPPAKFTLPNVDGLAPGTVTELFSFDHDIGQFVSIGTGTVSEDGLVVQSDPGFGIVAAGWHCGTPPSGSGAAVTPNVRITTRAPVIVGENQMLPINATGSPSQDVVYSWSIGESRIATLKPSGSGLCPNSGICNTSAMGVAPGITLATVTLICTRTGATAQDQIDVLFPQVQIKAEAIDQDTPDNDEFAPLTQDLVYGGSEPSTADNLKLKAEVSPPGFPILRYTWTVAGAGSSAYTPPSPSPTASEWNVGDIKPQIGDLEFKVVVEFQGGGRVEKTRKIEVGVRTDDVILVGWIDGDGVNLRGGASGWLTTLLPPTGPSLLSVLDCSLFLFELSENITTPNFNNLTLVDRDYILHWLFKFASNPDPATVIPGGDFRDANGSKISYGEVFQFIVSFTSYKLFNHFQIKFQADGFGFKVPPAILHAEASIGSTESPCGLGDFPGQPGPANGPPSRLTTNQRATLINDGSPDSSAIRAFNTLTGKDLPPGVTAVFWEDIGSKIEFRFDGGATPTVVMQPYPTYYEYRNGRFFNRVSQAPSPRGNFQLNPYPFGTVSCPGPGGITPGGRCGDASAPADASARTPPYTQP